MGNKGYKIFLSGPMTGYPHYNFARFDELATEFRRLGFEVVNPAEIGRKFDMKKVAKSQDLYYQMTEEVQSKERTCNAIFLMNGWERSVGVRLELKTAIDNAFTILVESNFEWSSILNGKRSKFK